LRKEWLIIYLNKTINWSDFFWLLHTYAVEIFLTTIFIFSIILIFYCIYEQAKNIASHSQWPSILTNRPHFGHTVKGCFVDGESSSVSLEYTRALISIIGDGTL
jgi:hypothetical protein